MQKNESSLTGKEEQESFEVPKEEYERLMMISIQDELKSKLVAWAKRQVWIVILIVTVLGTFGVSFVIESMVKDEVEKEVSTEIRAAKTAAVNAQIETENSRKALASLIKEREQATSELVTLRQSVKETLKDVEAIKANFAAIDADINNVRALSKNLQGDVSLLFDKSAVTENVEVEQKRRQRDQFDQNSRYSVLLFYRSNRKGDAQQIEKELVSLGYRSSSTYTDLSEATGAHDDGEIWLIYTKRGDEIRAKVAATVGALGFADRIGFNPKSSILKNGDMQILLF